MKGLETEISRLVAECLDNDELAGLGGKIDALFPTNWDSAQKGDELARAFVYAIEARRPGYPVDGEPGYLPCDAGLKAAVINEIGAMIEADFDNSEHAASWRSLKSSLEAAREADFAEGAEINCPNDYLLTVAKISCQELLKKKGVKLPF